MTETVTKTLLHGVAWCYDHKEVIGPKRAEDVGWDMAKGEHEECETEKIDEWEDEIEVPAEDAMEEKWDSSGTLGGVN